MPKIFPNLPLTGDFSCNDDALEAMNTNIETLDNLVLKGVEGLNDPLPMLGGLPEGYATINSSDNSLNVVTDGAWVSYAPKKGWNFINTLTSDSLLVFDGAAWVDRPLPSSFAPFISGAGNVGAGQGVFQSIVAGVAQFKSLIVGGALSISSTATEITISNTGIADTINVGTGEDVLKAVTPARVAEIKTLIGAQGIKLTALTDEIQIERENTYEFRTGAYTVPDIDYKDQYITNGASTLTLPTTAATHGHKITFKCWSGSLIINDALAASTMEDPAQAYGAVRVEVNSISLSIGQSVTYVNAGGTWTIISKDY